MAEGVFVYGYHGVANYLCKLVSDNNVYNRDFKDVKTGMLRCMTREK
jgi:hypothetical protein